jgi:ABC-type lipoprotein release transport system permease subunit
MGTILLMASRNLAANRKRTLLLGIAIALVTALLLLLSALFNGISQTMLRSATTLVTGHVNIAGFYKVTSGSVAPVVTKIADLKQVVEKLTPGVTLAVTRGRGWGKVISDKSSQQAAISGIDIAAERGFREVVQVESGSLNRLAEPHTMVLFQATAKRLEVKVGDTVTLSAPTFRGVHNTVDCTVVAIAQDLGMFSGFSVYVPEQTVRDLYHLDPGASGAIQVYLDDAERAATVAANLRKDLEKAGYGVLQPVSKPFWMKFDTVKREDWTGQKIDVTIWTDEMQFMRYTLMTLKVLIGFVVAILLVIIGIGVMNALAMTIRERTREIGTLRAIGMQKRRVLALFVTESTLLAFIGVAAGIVGSLALTWVLSTAAIHVSEGFQMFLMSKTLRLIVDVPTVVRAALIISAATVAAAVLPSWRAARMRPVVAMQVAK